MTATTIWKKQGEFINGMVDQGQNMALHQGRFSLRATKVTEIDPRGMVLSVDAAEAFDHVSRAAMLEALHEQQFYSSAGHYSWTDDQGRNHKVCQAEGDEQWDPLMHMVPCKLSKDSSSTAKPFLPSRMTSRSPCESMRRSTSTAPKPKLQGRECRWRSIRDLQLEGGDPV